MLFGHQRVKKILTNFRHALRTQTQSAHLALENTPLMRAMASGAPSLRHYQHYLAQQHRLFTPLEAQLRPWATLDWANLRLVKAQWLQADLQALGCAVPEPVTLPFGISSGAFALGVQYVLEGSTLGLQVIKKHLPAGHPALGQAGRFIHGYGTQTSSHWRVFMAHLEALTLADRPLAVSAAHATFAAFADVFSKEAPDD